MTSMSSRFVEVGPESGAKLLSKAKEIGHSRRAYIYGAHRVTQVCLGFSAAERHRLH